MDKTERTIKVVADAADRFADTMMKIETIKNHAYDMDNILINALNDDLDNILKRINKENNSKQSTPEAGINRF